MSYLGVLGPGMFSFSRYVGTLGYTDFRTGGIILGLRSGHNSGSSASSCSDISEYISGYIAIVGLIAGRF